MSDVLREALALEWLMAKLVLPGGVVVGTLFFVSGNAPAEYIWQVPLLALGALTLFMAGLSWTVYAGVGHD